MRSNVGRYAWNVQCALDHAQHNPIKSKNSEPAKQFGRYAWNAQCALDHAQHNPIKSKNSEPAKQFGRYAWSAQCVGIMRSIILFKVVKVNFEDN